MGKKVRTKVRKRLRNKVEERGWEQVGKRVQQKRLRKHVGNKFGKWLRKKVGNKLGKRLRKKVVRITRTLRANSISLCLCGHHSENNELDEI